ncbi:MAG: DUF488 domain-containing protein [bacterium]
MTIYTIGHSNISFESFVELLERHGIQTLVDVRSAPYSRFVEHFNYDYLDIHLPRNNISYEYMGDKLGGRPRSVRYTKGDGTADYEAMAQDETFIEGLDILCRMADQSVVCLMCSEEDPANCHRSKLVAAQLALRGVDVMHILSDGTLESEKKNAKRRLTIEERQIRLFADNLSK